MEQSARTRIDEEGNVLIPAGLLKGLGIDKGSFVIAERSGRGILLRPEKQDETEEYTPERVVEFLLGGAVDKASYDEAIEEVRKMGLDPGKIDHFKPSEVD